MNLENINYLDYGSCKKGTIVLLHGWGQNVEMMDMLGRPFDGNFRIINIDLPGFGDSKEPSKASSVKDYADIIHKLLEKLQVKNPILVGHSFGGRVAIVYSSLYECEKIVLLSSPFRPEKKKIPIKVKIYKIVKKMHIGFLTDYLKEKWGSTDYKNASDVMRGTLVKVVNEDLTEYARNINVPALLIYGTNDKDVLFKEAEALEKIIPDSGLVTYEGNSHYAYLERINQTISILDNFFN